MLRSLQPDDSAHFLYFRASGSLLPQRARKSPAGSNTWHDVNFSAEDNLPFRFEGVTERIADSVFSASALKQCSGREADKCLPLSASTLLRFSAQLSVCSEKPPVAPLVASRFPCPPCRSDEDCCFGISSLLPKLRRKTQKGFHALPPLPVAASSKPSRAEARDASHCQSYTDFQWPGRTHVNSPYTHFFGQEASISCIQKNMFLVSFCIVVALTRKTHLQMPFSSGSPEDIRQTISSQCGNKAEASWIDLITNSAAQKTLSDISDQKKSFNQREDAFSSRPRLCGNCRAHSEHLLDLYRRSKALIDSRAPYIVS